MTSAVSDKLHGGVIVPMITPIDVDHELDRQAVARLIEFFVEGGMHGVLALGTTGEALAVPSRIRDELIECVAQEARGRLLVYAGITGKDICETADVGNRYLRKGVNAVVAHLPAGFDSQEAYHYFDALAQQLSGELILYNIPLTTQVSLPVSVCGKLARKPRVIGVKDSENDRDRLDQMLQIARKHDAFSLFVGTNPLMATGLLAGAHGIVPSAANLAPKLCRQVYDFAVQRDQTQTEALHRQLMEVSAIYQQGRTLPQSLAALKAAMACLGLCGPGVFPPIQPVGSSEQAEIRRELVRLGILNDS